ncbi:MAG TPA: hypothetical protein VLD67_06980 [Vicinamibacterales bacterium]|nr:hypothetical protein [Vicinamibacterales bacterium]
MEDPASWFTRNNHLTQTAILHLAARAIQCDVTMASMGILIHACGMPGWLSHPAADRPRTSQV